MKKSLILLLSLIMLCTVGAAFAELEQNPLLDAAFFRHRAG